MISFVSDKNSIISISMICCSLDSMLYESFLQLLKLKSCLKQQNYKFLLGATYHTVCSVFRLQGEHWWISVQCSGGIFSCLITFVISGKIFLVYPKPHPWYYFMGLAIGLYYLLWVIGLQYYRWIWRRENACVSEELTDNVNIAWHCSKS